MVDTLASGASAFGREGSSPFSRTKVKRQSKGCLFTLVMQGLLPSPGHGGENCKSAVRKKTFRWQLVANREVLGLPKVAKSSPVN
jgi:hypothetical protein